MTDLTTNIYHYHDKPSEMRALDAAIQKNLTGDKLKEDIAVSQHFDDEVRSCETRVVLHPVGKAAMNAAAAVGYAKTTWVSYNRKLTGVPVQKSPHFVTLRTVLAESLPEQREGPIRDKNEPDTRLAIITMIEVRNAARDDPQPIEPVTDKAEDPLGFRVSVQNDLTCMGVLTADHSTVPQSESPEILHYDNPAEAALPSWLHMPGRPLQQAREGPLSRKEAKKPPDVEMESPEKTLRAQPRILSPAETTLLE